MKMVQIRNVPDEIHATLKSREPLVLRESPAEAISSERESR